jgi:predicted ferric reductase
LDERARKHSRQQLHSQQGVMSSNGPAAAEGEQLLDQAKPSLLHYLAPVAALAVDIAVVGSGASSQTVWQVIRASGIIAYVLLTVSVAAGLLITNRVLPVGRSRVDAFEIHSFTALLVMGFVSIHIVALLLDSFIGFSPLDIVVPFIADYRPLAVAAGILGLYVTLLVYGSVWLRSRIGYKTWRTLHYASFGAFALAAAHGIFSGADSEETWMVFIYIASLAVVGGLTWRRVTTASDNRRLKAV